MYVILKSITIKMIFMFFGSFISQSPEWNEKHQSLPNTIYVIKNIFRNFFIYFFKIITKDRCCFRLTLKHNIVMITNNVLYKYS